MTDTSTNGTFIKLPEATLWQRLPKNEPTRFAVGCHLRLSAPQKDAEPLEYRLESHEVLENYHEEHQVAGHIAVMGSQVPGGSKGNESGGARKRVRQSLEYQGDEQHIMAKEDTDLIDQVMNLQESNATLRAELRQEREAKLAIQLEFNEHKETGAKSHALLIERAEQAERRMQQASQEIADAEKRFEKLQEECGKWAVESAELKAAKIAAENDAQNLREDVSAKSKLVEELGRELAESREKLGEAIEHATDAERQKIEAQTAMNQKEASMAALEKEIARRDTVEAELQAAVNTKHAANEELQSRIVELESELHSERRLIDELRLSEEGSKEWDTVINVMFARIERLALDVANRSQERARMMGREADEAAKIVQDIQRFSKNTRRGGSKTVGASPLMGTQALENTVPDPLPQTAVFQSGRVHTPGFEKADTTPGVPEGCPDTVAETQPEGVDVVLGSVKRIGLMNTPHGDNPIIVVEEDGSPIKEQEHFYEGAGEENEVEEEAIDLSMGDEEEIRNARGVDTENPPPSNDPNSQSLLRFM